MEANATITVNKQQVNVVKSFYSIPAASFKRWTFDNSETYNNPLVQSGFIFVVYENGKFSGKILESYTKNSTSYKKLTAKQSEKIIESLQKI
jgi:hypothetical protein